ncbi:MAG: TlpA family protein disulfide reductase [Ilumatobacteraceae bacterium]
MTGRVKVRTRLLVGSLVVSLVASVGLGLAIASCSGSGNDGDVAVLDPNIKPPTIGTNAVVEGTPLPAIDVQTRNGDTLSTSELIGQPLVINVWGSTCGPCKKELPDFAAAHAVYGDRVRFVGIDYLPPSDHEEEFARSKGVQYELLYDAAGDFVNTMGISAFPVTLVVTADGNIVQQTGQLNEAKLTALIEEYLL